MTDTEVTFEIQYYLDPAGWFSLKDGNAGGATWNDRLSDVGSADEAREVYVLALTDFAHRGVLTAYPKRLVAVQTRRSLMTVVETPADPRPKPPPSRDELQAAIDELVTVQQSDRVGWSKALAKIESLSTSYVSPEQERTERLERIRTEYPEAAAEAEQAGRTD